MFFGQVIKPLEKQFFGKIDLPGRTSSQEYCTQALPTPFLKQDVSNKMRAKVSEYNLSPLNPHCYKIHQIWRFIVGYFLQGEDSSSSSPGKILHSSFWLHLSRAIWRTKVDGGVIWIIPSDLGRPLDILAIYSQICRSFYPVGHRQGPHFPYCFGYFFPRADITWLWAFFDHFHHHNHPNKEWLVWDHRWLELEHGPAWQVAVIQHPSDSQTAWKNCDTCTITS